MKETSIFTTFATTILAVSAVWLAAPALAEEAETRLAAEIVAAEPALEGRVVQAEVIGMVCDFCAQSLKKVLGRKDAVSSVDISLETKLITIILNEGMALSDEEIAEAVNWAGYELAGIVRA
ncbi:MAG: heavy-metal-associated domain-containing protein [Aquisalinus sp.]|nr:heavy-metal-associated domain-containing protein [Aquisalinus sp.]